MESLYDQDFYRWALRNAELMREGKLSEIDTENIAEELEAMGKSQKRELISRLSVLIMHLLKWRYRSQNRGDSWVGTIMEQRTEIGLLIEDSPSLKNEIEKSMGRAYSLAMIKFEKETKIAAKDLPASCPYSFDRTMDSDFWPESDQTRAE